MNTYQQQPVTNPQEGLAPAAPVIESASATTSPDNANSGPAAYFIALGALVVLGLVFLLVFSSCSSILQIARQEVVNQDVDITMSDLEDLSEDVDMTSDLYY